MEHLKETALAKGIKWIHLSNPRDVDVKELKKEFRLHPVVLDELLNPSDRIRVEKHHNYLYLIYHLPIYNSDERTSRKAEIDFIATEKTLITTTYEAVEPLFQFERDLGGKLKGKISSVPEALYYILEEVNDFSMRQMRHVEKKVIYVGEELFRHPDRKLLEEISHIKRDLLDFSLIAVPQKSVLDSLAKLGPTFWGEEYREYFDDLLGDFSKEHFLLENLKATIVSYSETISQIFQFRTSEIVRRFSILGFLTFPLLLYSTLALQPQIITTFIRTPYDFWYFFGAVTLFSLALALIFKKRGWL